MKRLPLALLAIAFAALLATGFWSSLPALETHDQVTEVLPGDPYAGETAAERDARMKWWREARFGMFIHWGVYAVPAGNYEGKCYPSISEWLLRNAKIPMETYRGYASDFTAEHYDPESWAKLAKEAGMRYMVITSKHHDGFALYPSEVSEWNALDAAASKRDLIEPLAKAARAEGIKFGLYYSQAQDWMHPGGTIYGYDEGKVFNPEHAGNFERYLKEIAEPQVREILTRYQPDVLWWDTPVHMTRKRAEPLAKLLSLSPGIIHNNRLGGGYIGDTETPELYIPPTGYGDRDWETCMTMNNSWGYKREDHDWKSSRTLINHLINTASKGGNYLLNVGPDASGRIPKASIDRLKEVGAWMKVNGEGIYGTSASPFLCRLAWGRCTTKQDGKRHALYAHVYNWPSNRRLLLPGLSTKVESAKLLINGKALTVEQTPHGPLVHLPAKAPDSKSTTIRLELNGEPEVRCVPVLADGDGVLRLTPVDAKLRGDLKLGSRGGKDIVTAWNHARDPVSWDLEAPADGNYRVEVQTSCQDEGAVFLIQGKGLGKLACAVPQTKNPKTFKTTRVGDIKLKKGSRVTLALQPVADGWKPVNLRKVELVPHP